VVQTAEASAAVVWQKSSKTVLLPNGASILSRTLCNQPGTEHYPSL